MKTEEFRNWLIEQGYQPNVANTRVGNCLTVCNYEGEIQIVKDEETGRLIWECPNCGNRNQDKMHVTRRTCGYIGTQFWNQGRTEEIQDRVLHVSIDAAEAAKIDANINAKGD